MLQIKNVYKQYRTGNLIQKALDDVSLNLRDNEFDTEEEKWAYWAKHIYLNDTGMAGTKLYQNILKLVKEKECGVIRIGRWI